MIRSSIGNSRTMQSSFNFQPSQTPGMLTSGEYEQFEPVLKQISALNFQKIFHIYELTVRVSDGTNGATARGGYWGSLPESPHAESAARTKAAGRNRANERPRLSGDTRNVMRTRRHCRFLEDVLQCISGMDRFQTSHGAYPCAGKSKAKLSIFMVER